MAKLGRVLAAAAAAGCLCRFLSTSFVPAPSQRRAADVAAIAAALGGAATPALADKIDDAAAKLTTAAYPFLKEVNWNSKDLWTLPGAKPGEVAKAVAKTLEMGAAMDGKAVKLGVLAHSNAIAAIGQDGVATKADFQAINAAIGHMIASAGEAKTMAVYNAWKPLVPAGAPAYLKSTVNGQDADAAYKALMEFKDVVRSEASRAGAAAPQKRKAADAIDTAAKKLSEAAYPLMKKVDWNADYFAKLPDADPQVTLKAVKNALDHGAVMDWGYLQEGALAHAKAISKMDATGVLAKEDFEKINAAIGHMMFSAGALNSMNTFNAFSALTPSSVPPYLMSTVGDGDAQKAYAALLEFTKVVGNPASFSS